MATKIDANEMPEKKDKRKKINSGPYELIEGGAHVDRVKQLHGDLDEERIKEALLRKEITLDLKLQQRMQWKPTQYEIELWKSRQASNNSGGGIEEGW